VIEYHPESFELEERNLYIATSGCKLEEEIKADFFLCREHRKHILQRSLHRAESKNRGQIEILKCSCEHREHSKGVDPQQNNNGCRIDHVPPNMPLFGLPAVA